LKQSDNYSQQSKIERLNQHCVCVTLDWPTVELQLLQLLGDDADNALSNSIMRQFFSNVAVFVPDSDLNQMLAIVQAIESTAALPDYQRQVLSWAPASAKYNPGQAGAFMGFDFHLSKDGPRLIEINTNAGGAFLNSILARAQSKCCGGQVHGAWTENFDEAVIAQFISEWRVQRGSGQPEIIAIIDDVPTEQHLYPEFILAQQLLSTYGINTVILSPSDLRYEAGGLYTGNQRIDMVYNRLVDFGLETPEHDALRSAWLEGGVVITPNPHTHAMFADKRNLAVMSDQQLLMDWGLSPGHAELLQNGIPHTVRVTACDEESLWQHRRQWFFKPVAGHGSKGVYRGSKLTKSTFARILEGDYVAQAFVPPSERMVMVDGERKMLKVDVRLYTYGGSQILAAARLYQGQTTNLRTPGGGFAPILTQNN